MTYFTRKSLERAVTRMKGLSSKVASDAKGLGEACVQGAESWHDNAPYEMLVHQVQMGSTKLKDFVEAVRHAQILEYPADPQGRVCYGSAVDLNMDGRDLDFMIVGFGDQNEARRRILYNSPFAKQLIGHKVGDMFMADYDSEEVGLHIKAVRSIFGRDFGNDESTTEAK